MHLALDHVALVTPSIEGALERIREGAPALARSVGPIEEFPGEGTRELYLGEPGPAARLLLMEPLSGADAAGGPYARALARRGPGLHHVGLLVPDLDAFLAAVRGWLCHPRTVFTRERSRTAWLARPGVPILLEVQERAADALPLERSTSGASPTRVLLRTAGSARGFVTGLGVPGLEETEDGDCPASLLVAGGARAASWLAGAP